MLYGEAAVSVAAGRAPLAALNPQPATLNTAALTTHHSTLNTSRGAHNLTLYGEAAASVAAGRAPVAALSEG